MSELLEAHKTMIRRYRALLVSNSGEQRWINYCDTALTLTNTDKLSRWVGFIQGVLFSQGQITIEEERDYSRDIYKPVYQALGMDSTTVDVN